MPEGFSELALVKYGMLHCSVTSANACNITTTVGETSDEDTPYSHLICKFMVLTDCLCQTDLVR